MLFISYEFLLFLAAVLILYYTIPRRHQWKLLLAASYVFYFLSDPKYLIFLVTTTVSTFWVSQKIQSCKDDFKVYFAPLKKTLSMDEKKAVKEKEQKKEFRLLLLCLLLNLGVLAVVKYTDFAILNVNHLLHLFGQDRQFSYLRLLLPMGISFYTFQSLGYLIDVYNGKYRAEENLFRFALFVSFFPQLVQGPISRFDDLSKSLYAEHTADYRTITFGLQRILWGYFKKLVIADRIVAAVIVLSKNSVAYGGAYVFANMLFYTLQLYADFTGGIDVTIGIAQAMGITVQENFVRPHFSKSLKEYWRRWHISMGTWFRDYIFYPISICKSMRKFTKFSRSHFGEAVGRRLPVYIATLVTWFATGIWHGASWNFIVWGVGNAVILMISQELEPLYDRFHARFGLREKIPFAYKCFEVGRTLLLVCCLKLFDCYATVGETFRAFGSLLVARNWHVLWDGSLLTLGLTMQDYVIVVLGFLALVSVSLVQRSGSVREKIAAKPVAVRFVIWYGLFLLVLLLGAYGIGYDAKQFIYNRF